MKKTKYKNWCVLLLLMIGLGSMILMFYYYKVREVANQERSYINIAASSEQIRDSSFFWGEHEIVQQIRPEENKITKFCIMFQRNMEVPAEGILHVELYDVQNDTVVQQWDLHESKIQGIDYQIFPLAAVKEYGRKNLPDQSECLGGLPCISGCDELQILQL